METEVKMKYLNLPCIEIIEGSNYDDYTIIHNEYVYTFQKETSTCVYFKCRIEHCEASALVHMFNKGKGFLTCYKEHIHPKETNYIKKVQFRRALRVKFEQNPNCNISELYKKTVKTFGDCYGLTLPSAKRFLLGYNKKCLSESPPPHMDVPVYEDTEENEYDCDQEEPFPDSEDVITTENRLSDSDDGFRTEIVGHKFKPDNNDLVLRKTLNKSSGQRKKRDNRSSFTRLKDCSVPGVRLSPTNLRFLAYDDYAYEIKKRSRYLVNLSCKNANCRGSAVIYLNDKNEGIVQKTRPHDHPPDANAVNELLFNSGKEINLERRNSLQPPNENHSESLAMNSFESEDSSQIYTPQIEEMHVDDNYLPPSLNSQNNNSTHEITGNDFQSNQHGEPIFSSPVEVSCELDVIETSPVTVDTLVNEDDWFAANYVGNIGEYLRKCNIPGVEILEGLRIGSLVLVYEGYVYLTKLRRKRKANLRCRIQCCAGTACVQIKPFFTGQIISFKCHTHRPDINYINYLKFRKELRIEAIKSPLRLSCKQIFDNVDSRFRQNGVICDLNFNSLVGIILRARTEVKETHESQSKSVLYEECSDNSNIPTLTVKSNSSVNNVNNPDSHVSDVVDLEGTSSCNVLEENADKISYPFEFSDDAASDVDTDFIASSGNKMPPTKTSESLCNTTSFSHIKEDLMRRHIPGTEKLQGFRLGGLIIVHQRHAYIISIQRNDIVYMRCRKKDCRGSGIIRLIGDIEGYFSCHQPHNHPPDATTAGNLKFRHLLRKECIINPMLPSREIYSRVFAYYRGEHNVTFSTVESLMFRTKQRLKPPAVKSIPEIASILTQPKWSGQGTSYHMPKRQPWFRGSYVAEDGTQIAVFINECLRKTIHAFQPMILHFDVSYDIQDDVLKNHHLLSCHIVLKDEVFGFGFFLVSKKSTVGFGKCFEVLQSHCCSEQLEPTLIHTDYEPTLQAAIRSTWPLTTTRGCFYHYAQAIIKKFYKDNPDFRENTQKRTILKYYISLALLPPHEIVRGQQTINDIINDNQTLSDSFWLLNEYFCDFWLNKTGPQTFSVYDKLNRTNDNVELFHYKLKHALGARRDLWSFIDALRVLSHNEEANYLAFIGGGNNKIPSKKIIHMKQDKALGNTLKNFTKGLEFSEELPIEDKEKGIRTVIISFMDSAATALENLLERVLQEPKTSKVTRPKRVLISASNNALKKITEMQPAEFVETEFEENKPSDHEFNVQEEDGSNLMDGMQEVANTVEVVTMEEEIQTDEQRNSEVNSCKIADPLFSLLDHDYDHIIFNDE